MGGHPCFLGKVSAKLAREPVVRKLYFSLKGIFGGKGVNRKVEHERKRKGRF